MSRSRLILLVVVVSVLAYGSTLSSARATYAQFQETAYTVGDGNNAVVITVARGDGLDDVISVNYATSDDTAVAGQDCAPPTAS